MSRRIEGYLSANGERLPSVTSIISQNLGWNKQALLSWANECGLEGKRHREVSGQAAKAGKLCHAMIEHHLKGEFFDTSGYDEEVLQKAQTGFNNFLSWESEVDLTPVATEKPLVSEKYRYGGTPDYIGTVNGELALVDWKTSERVFPDMLVQLAAYAALWEENYQPLTGGFHILCLGKESATFSPHHFEALSAAMDTFLHLLALHQLHTELERLT
jgi:hypothetical protein